MTLVDLDELSSETLRHLASLAYERERREQQLREEQLVRVAELFARPTIGWHMRRRQEMAAQ